ncbi:hypothetical protein C8A05DRAFT_41414 [Staphylotrichum tortipilum]|uniref:Ankyrin repeat protein n=1 Tax=Staphylotrichum tortipilum TaxID=2831512 RepID=A0AAN6MRR7_9PEZI|nr:hypothetical protein C8A05DRAFT_41414 [Staphylotrichum longicolle]
MPPNPYLLAADNPQALLPLLAENPALASIQDEHGYSLIHAAASYNHLDLLRALVRDFHAPVDLKDEDGETALFVVETVEAARVLVEELKLDAGLLNHRNWMAREKIEYEEEWPAVVAYLRGLEEPGPSAPNGVAADAAEEEGGDAELPGLPEGLRVTMGTMNEAEAGEQQPDPEFRRRIEELAAREDFQTPEGQADLRRLVEEAIGGEGFGADRNVRQREE